MSDRLRSEADCAVEAELLLATGLQFSPQTLAEMESLTPCQRLSRLQIMNEMFESLLPGVLKKGVLH
jgi:hypothetical protein